MSTILYHEHRESSMNFPTSRHIPQARVIDEFQDSIADPKVKAGLDISGYILILPVFGIVGSFIGAALIQFGVIDEIVTMASMLSSLL